MEAEQKVCSDLQQDTHIFLNIWGSADPKAACPEGTQQEEQAQGMGTQSASKAGQHQQNHTAPPTLLQLGFSKGEPPRTPKAMPTPLPQTSGCRHSCSPPPAPARSAAISLAVAGSAVHLEFQRCAQGSGLSRARVCIRSCGVHTLLMLIKP